MSCSFLRELYQRDKKLRALATLGRVDHSLELAGYAAACEMNADGAVRWKRVLHRMERVMGIEPTLAAWEAAVLPLNYTRDPY